MTLIQIAMPVLTLLALVALVHASRVPAKARAAARRRAR